MSKIKNQYLKNFFVSLGVLAILGSLYTGVSYFNQNLTNNSNFALAALNCPAGSTLNTAGTGCVSTTPSSYECPGSTLGGNGAQCFVYGQTGTSYSCPSGGVHNGAGVCVTTGCVAGESLTSDVETPSGYCTTGASISVRGGDILSYPSNYTPSGCASGAENVFGQYGQNAINNSNGLCYSGVDQNVYYDSSGGPTIYLLVRPTNQTIGAATPSAIMGWVFVGNATPVYGTAVTATSYTPGPNQISGITCDNTSPIVGSSINCTAVGTGAPSGIPYGGSVTLSIDNGGGTSTCTFTGSATATCTPISVGSTVGAKTVTTSSGGTLSINVIRVNFGKVDWIFNPDQGGTSPLFRSTDNTSITVNNFRTIFDPTPSSNTRYTCTFEYRNLNDRLSTTSGSGNTWTSLNTTPIPYTTGAGTNSGCTINLTKQQRANTLNHSLRLTITDTTISNPSTTNPNTYIFYNEYIYRFQGAGVASGG